MRQTQQPGAARWAAALALAAACLAVTPLHAQRPKPVWRFEHDASVDCVAVSPDSNMAATGGAKGLIRTWSLETGKRVASIEERGRRPTQLFFLDGGRVLLAYFSEFHSRGELNRWRSWLAWYDARTGKRLRGMDFEDKLHPVALSPDGKTLACGSGVRKDLSLKLRDAMTAKVQGEMHPLDHWHLAFTPDGKQLVMGHTSSRIEVYDVQTKKEVRTLRLDLMRRELAGMAVAPDSKRLAVALADEGWMVELATGKKLWTAPVTSPWSPLGRPVLFAKKGRWLVAIDSPGYRVNAIDADLGVAVAAPVGYSQSSLMDVALSPDEKWVATADGGDQNAKVYRFTDFNNWKPR